MDEGTAEVLAELKVLLEEIQATTKETNREAQHICAMFRKMFRVEELGEADGQPG